jgi:replicative DNA helicase
MNKLWRELSERTFLLTWPAGMKDANQTLLEYCGRDTSKFQDTVQKLTIQAKSQPMPDVYSIQEVLQTGEDTILSEHPERLRFPWSSADKMVNILPGNVLGVGSTNTGMGKTTWTVQLTMHNARKYNRVVLNYQAEMQPSEIATMVAAQVLRKDRNFLTNDDKKLAATELEGIQYYVGCNPTLSDINAVLDVIEAGIKRLGADIVCLDHFHHLTTGVNNETQVQAAAMTRIKQMAEAYKVIFINVGQPRKANQQTKGKQIHITDFKGSGAWGDASNAVIAIHRELSKSEEPSMSKGVYEDKTLVKVLKARSMGIGSSACFLTSFGEFASFEEIENNYPEGEPE